MTVISAMKFNRTCGALVSDEQASTEVRKYDIASKIHELRSKDDKIAILGGAGASDVLYEAAQDTIKAIEKNQGPINSAQDLLNILGQVMSKQKRRYIEIYMQNFYGLTEAELQSGQKKLPDGSRIQLDPTILREYHALIQGERDFSQLLKNKFLSLTFDGEVQIFSVSSSFTNPIPVSRPYSSIGSGEDIADEELYSFLERIPREERENIDPVKGLCALLNATDRASTINIGVGGTPSIKILTKATAKEKGKIINKVIITSPSENASKLAIEIVKATRRNYLPPEFEEKAILQLLFRKKDFREIEREMWNNTTDKKKLSLLLRGYKVN